MVRLLSFILLICVSTGAKRKISDVYLLLPQTLHAPNARHVKYTIQAYEGCYRWTSANSKVVALTELTSESFNFDQDCKNPSLEREFQGLECYPGALLEPVAIVEHPPVTLISAIDQTSRSETLKCEVKVGRITRLEILTTVKSFRVLDNQRLFAQAFDEDGNVFSSLEGLRFRWQIVEGAESLGLPKLKDSLATLSNVRKEIENSNYQSDVILVEGKSTGVANVTLKIEEPGYENVALAWTLIYISEPFALLPSPEVYLPICSKFNFRIFKVLEGKNHKEVVLPSAEYKWSVTSEYLAVRNDGQLETFAKEGKWAVSVQDSKIESNILQCEVNVIKPDRIIVVVEQFTSETIKKSLLTQEEFQLLINPQDQPKSNWFLISEQKYKIKVLLYWRNKEITVSPNSMFSITFAENRLWEVVSKSQNGAEIIVIPILPPEFSNNIYPTKVSAKLEYFDSSNSQICRLDSAITDTEEANIIRKVQIIEEKVPVLLPYFAVLTQNPDKTGHTAQEYRLRIRGGSFSLRWESSDNSVVTVNPNGVIYAHRLGTSIVSVIDTNNENNKDSIEVEVTLIEKLIWEYERLEIVRGSLQLAEIKGLASRDRIFHNCSSILLDWELRKGQDLLKVKNRHFVNDDRRKSGICEIRNIEAVNEGQVLISTHLINQASDPSPKQPEIRLSSEEGRIGIFVPLSVTANENYEIVGNTVTNTFLQEKFAIVLTPGASTLLELVGGPLPWEDNYPAHKEIIKDTDRSSIISKNFAKDKRFLLLKCPDGLRGKDYPISLSVYNEKFDKLKVPGLSTLEIVLGCYPPFNMKLDWIRDSQMLFPANWNSLPFYYDRFKRRLVSDFNEGYWVILHAQELKVNVTLWDLKGREIFNFSSANLEWISDKQELISYSKILTPSNEKVVKIGINEGPVSLEARIDRLKDGSILSPPVTSSLNNEVVKNVEVSPQEYSLYLHKQNVLEVMILYGSGYFEVSSNSTDAIVYTYDGYRKISVFPKRGGRVSIRVDDTGLPGSRPAYCNILISALAGMELKEGGLIPVNSTISLSLIALDSEGKVFKSEEIKWMGIELALGNAFSLIGVSNSFEEWELKGFKIGEFQVYAIGYKTLTREDDKYSVRSNVITIDVFPPLEIIPPEVLLIPGSKYTLNYRGGPDPSKYNFYSIYTAWVMKDENIAVIDSNSGLVTALKIGDTPISLQMVRKRNLLTQAEGKIRVRLVTGVGIIGMGPGRTVLKDSATRLIAVLYHNGEEVTDATMSISYTWKSNSPTVYSIFQENEDPGKQIAVTGLALTGGKSDITLHVDISYPLEYKDHDHLFNSKATASVDPGLYSQTPSHRCHSYITFGCSDEFPRWLDSTVFLLPPYSSFKFPLNKEEKTVYRCLDCREDFLKLSDNGVLTSGGQKGESSIVVQHVRIRGDYHIIPISITDIESIHIDKAYLGRNIALGTELDFDITYQDTMARSFPKNFDYGIDVSFEVSNSRVLSASLENRNSTLRIHSQYVGDTIIKVFLTKNPSVKDILKVSVSSVMKPVSPINLHLGGEIQFETTHSTPAGVTGSWSSENSNIVNVNDAGFAKSFQEGDTYIHYREKSMDLKSLVLVNKVKAIELGHDSPIQITNYEKHPSFREKYKIPIRLFADTEKNREFVKLNEDLRKNIKQNIHVRCVTNSHSDFVVVESEIDKADKERWAEEPGYGCIVTPIINPTTASIAGKELIITIIVSAKGKSLYSFESNIGIPFVPKFTLPGQDKQIVITGKSTTHTILIAGGCGALQINSDTSSISVKKNESGGKCLVELTVLPTETELKLKRIEIIDSITGQKEELLLSYYSDASKVEISSPLGPNDLIIMIAIIVLVYLLYTHFKTQSPPSNPVYRPGYNPPRYPSNIPPQRNQTPGPVGPPSSPGSSLFKNIAYRPNF